MHHIRAYFPWTRRKRIHLIADMTGRIVQEHQRLTHAFEAMLALDEPTFLLIEGKKAYRITVEPTTHPSKLKD